MTTTFDIDEIERLLAAATPGEWEATVQDNGDYLSMRGPKGECIIGGCSCSNSPFMDNSHDAALIVTLRNSAPAMIAELRELRAENARLREAMKGPLAWLERWAVHVGNCETNPECTCGLMLAQHELRAALGEPQ